MAIPPANKVTASAYIVLEPQYNRNHTMVTGIRAAKMTAGKPALGSGQIAVRVKLNFDADSLMQAIPEIEVDVNGFSTPLIDILTGGT